MNFMKKNRWKYIQNHIQARSQRELLGGKHFLKGL